MKKLTLWVVVVSMLVVGGRLRAEEAKKEVVFDGDQIGENAKGWTHAPIGQGHHRRPG